MALKDDGSRTMMTSSVDKTTKKKLKEMAEGANLPESRTLDMIIAEAYNAWQKLGNESRKTRTAPLKLDLPDAAPTVESNKK
ncbi:MAG: hypothetical protein FWE53_03125 [Firmicutes bacterium]|nr:hypothetical protein [Bacillota bacterium]